MYDPVKPAHFPEHFLPCEEHSSPGKLPSLSFLLEIQTSLFICVHILSIYIHHNIKRDYLWMVSLHRNFVICISSAPLRFPAFLHWKCHPVTVRKRANHQCCSLVTAFVELSAPGIRWLLLKLYDWNHYYIPTNHIRPARVWKDFHCGKDIHQPNHTNNSKVMI